MAGKIDKTPQLNMFQVPLTQFVKEGHELVVLSRQINWDYLEYELGTYYCADNGRPGMPIRKLCGVLMLKRMFNESGESDESDLQRWVENPCWKSFCGEVNFQHDPPFDRTELTKFLQRIGEAGAEKILKASIDKYSPNEVREKEVLIDTSVQEKNITAGRMTRELDQGIRLEQKEGHHKLLLTFNKILSQQRDCKDKIYSIHEPHVKCIAKGKEAKKYEYGNKVSIAKTRRSGIIVGALSFLENVYVGATLESQLNQIERVTSGHKPQTGIVDRGYQGRKWVDETWIVISGKLLASATNYQKHKTRKQLRARAGIEPVLGHLKHDHRMNRTYLSGNLGDTMNVLLAAAGFNMRKMLLR